METQNQRTNSVDLKLHKAYTFFMVPFYYEGEWSDIHKNISRWQPIEKDIYKEEILYPYIIDLFKRENKETARGESKEDTSLSDSRLQIYQLRTEDNGYRSQFFIDRILGKRNVAIIDYKSRGKKCIPFTFLNDDNWAPHLFISPTAKIGIMTFSMALDGNCNTKDLQDFNYELHKRNETKAVKIVTKDKQGNKKSWTDKRTANYRCLCPIPDAHKNLSDEDFMKQVTQFLSEDGYTQLLTEQELNNVDHVSWDLNYFIGFLLATLKGYGRVKYFNKERLHVYTYSCIDDSNEGRGEVRKESVIEDLLRLARAVDSKYLLPFDDMIRNGSVLQTYQNMYFASAIEGTSMICLAKDINKKFISEAENIFNHQYLVIYILVLIQRYTLLSLNRKFAEFTSHIKLNEKPTEEQQQATNEKLWVLIDVICKIKVNCYYTDVSVYTQHSQFYQHCCRNLHVPETFREIDEKVELLKSVTGRRMQQALDAQAKQQKQMVTNQNIAREKDERLQNLLNLIVALLTIFQVMQAVHELANLDTDESPRWAIVAGAVSLFFIVVAYLWAYYKDKILRRS